MAVEALVKIRTPVPDSHITTPYFTMLGYGEGLVNVGLAARSFR